MLPKNIPKKGLATPKIYRFISFFIKELKFINFYFVQYLFTEKKKSEFSSTLNAFYDSKEKKNGYCLFVLTLFKFNVLNLTHFL